MLDVLTKHINGDAIPKICVVAKWIEGLEDEEQKAFQEVIAHNQDIHVAALFNDLKKETNLPFKLTAFRSHLRGYCTCQH